MPKKQKKILADHKQVGKKLIPPMLQLSGGINFVKWLDHILPELIWIGLLQEKLGIKRSVEVCNAIAEIGKGIVNTTHPISMAYISNYRKLNNQQAKIFFEQMASRNIYEDFSIALKELIYLYPECPLTKLIEHQQKNGVDSPEEIKRFKRHLDKYFYRREYSTNLIEGTALYMAWIAGIIKYGPNVTIPDLEALANHQPDEEIYQKVSASVRSSTQLLMKDLDTTWCQYFWNRGLQIDRCQK